MKFSRLSGMNLSLSLLLSFAIMGCNLDSPKPISESELMVTAKSGKRISAVRKEKGTPTIASMALRKPTVNHSTKITKTTPSSRLLRMMSMRAET